ncbi:MAG: UDP-N-acetylmuramate dehydrogenase [Deltaproteobacteria bacterium]|nr:UDP-N-acetylmuramate dehydrogenase [Deltaproteobacteria bacterium]
MVERDVPMKEHTTFKVGGPADIVAYPLDRVDLKETFLTVKQSAAPCFVLGLGSNLLVKDGGIRGVVINLSKGLREINLLSDNRLQAGAGATLAAAVARAAGEGLEGMEFLSGIPGTVGGAVRMNAGAFGKEMKDVIESVTLMNREGEEISVMREDLSFSYRNLDFEEGHVITGCTFALTRGDESEIRERIRKYALQRGSRQPLGKATAGSVFKNPGGDYAGRLIEAAGLKGFRAGNARISEKHANFIENCGGAKAAHILELIAIAKKRVYDDSGILLETEVKIIGED